MRSLKAISSVLALTLLMSGCAAGKVQEEPVTETTFEESTTTTTTACTTTEITTTVREDPIEFNPHVYSAKLAESIGEDHWQAFYNLCDALRKGEDSFECSNMESYLWATDTITLRDLFPFAAMKVSQADDPYEAGIGKIKYIMAKEEFVKGEKDFETQVTADLNKYVKSSYSDFEKCVALYDYMETEYTYDYDWDTYDDDGLVYKCFKSRTGLCVELAGVYSYMLLQVGIDALSCSCFSDICHSWTYVTLKGKSYHIDPTWGLRSESGDGSLSLTYFLNTDSDRKTDGVNFDDCCIQLLPEYWLKDSDKVFSATDDSYNEFWMATFSRMDTDKNILYYLKGDEEHEFHYED